MPARCAAGSTREDLFTVVHDPFMTQTARYADIVLPAATYLETEDLYRAYGAYYLQYAPASGRAAGRGLVEFAAGAGLGRAARARPTRSSRMPPHEIAAAMLRGRALARRPALDPERVRDGGPVHLGAG